jgi:ABC-type nitrate/sulfonate/bicarbonate transport system substrate-binding protein
MALNSMYIKIFSIIVLAGLAVLAFIFFNSEKQGTTSIRELRKVTVQLKWRHQAQFAGIYAAKELGFYKAAGLDVNIERGGPDRTPLAQVVSGKAEFGVAGADDVLVGVSEGKAIKAIAAIYQESPVIYFALKESGITTPQDFIGKRVGVRKGTGTYYTYIAMLNNLGIDRSKITEVPADTSEITLLLEKKVDILPGFRTNEPKVAERMGYEVNIIKPEDFGIDIYADVLVTTQEVINRDYELVRMFVNATLDGWEWAVANQEAAVDITMKYVQDSTREHQQDMLEETAVLIKRSQATKIGQINFSKWNRTYTLLRQYGVISNDIDINTAYTTEFLQSL